MTPERIVGNASFFETLKCLYWKVSFCYSDQTYMKHVLVKILVTDDVICVLPYKSQGQLAGFVIDEAHCVRYVLTLHCL